MTLGADYDLSILATDFAAYGLPRSLSPELRVPSTQHAATVAHPWDDDAACAKATTGSCHTEGLPSLAPSRVADAQQVSARVL